MRDVQLQAQAHALPSNAPCHTPSALAMHRKASWRGFRGLAMKTSGRLTLPASVTFDAAVIRRKTFLHRAPTEPIRMESGSFWVREVTS